MSNEQTKLLEAFRAWMDENAGAVTVEQAFIQGALYGVRLAKDVYSPLHTSEDK